MSRFGKLLRWLLVFAVICAVTWLATVIGWQETHRVVDEADVLLFIVLLPLALFGLVLVLWFGIRATRRRSAARTASSVVTPTAPAAATAHQPEDAWLQAQLNVHAVAMTTAAGNDTESLMAKLIENQSLARPSKNQFDLDGFRIPLAAIDDLDLAEVEAWYDTHLKSIDPARHPAAHEAERLQRCLALLMPTMDTLLPSIEPLLQPAPQPVAPKPLRPSAHVANPPSPPMPTLRVVSLIADDFSAAARTLLKAWLDAQFAQAVSNGRAPVLLSVLPNPQDASPIKLLDRFNIDVHRAQGRDVLLLIGVDSQVDPGTVRRLESAGALRTATRPSGEVPGEAAFALAITADFVRIDNPEPLATLSRIASAQRARAPEHRGKVSSAALRDAVQASLAMSGETADACGTMICDGDGYGPRGLEAAEAMTFCLDPLDAVADRIALSSVLGDLGAATLPGLLCAAAAQAAATGKAALIVPLAAPLDRSVMLAFPPSPAASEPPQA